MEDFDLENPLASFHDRQSQTVSPLFSTESDHMPPDSYFHSFITRDFDVSLRLKVICLIQKAHFSCNVDPFIAYLAVNYFDRFISVQGMPQGEAWILKLLSVACLSLASKMKKTLFCLTDFQSEEGFIFDSQTIRRMELLILGALKWRMRSVTPFAFLDFFFSSLELNDTALKRILKARTREIIFKAQNEIKLLGFKPSIITASALLSACRELFPLQFPYYRKAISSCIYVNKEKLFDCHNLIQDVVMDGYDSMFEIMSSSDTPVNVLDHHCTSSESEKNSCTRSETEITQRKIRDFCNETIQL
ncbi:putative cyclin-D6-1 [Tasmannia lanceolata]|uniref:putative cyclin-D6-1 n=1 Tax=Tasmannia lanceolata TaxID=3420 RepID=UPI004063FC81